MAGVFVICFLDFFKLFFPFLALSQLKMVLFNTMLTELACFCCYKLTASFLHFQLHHFTHNQVTSDQHTPTLCTQCRIPCMEAYFLRSPWGSSQLRVTGNTLTGTACSSAWSVNFAIAKSHFSHNFFRNHLGRSSFRIDMLYQDWNLPPSWKPATNVAPWPTGYERAMRQDGKCSRSSFRVSEALLSNTVLTSGKLQLPPTPTPLSRIWSRLMIPMTSLSVLTPAGDAHCNSISCHILSFRDQMTWSCIIKIPLNWYELEIYQIMSKEMAQFESSVEDW